MNQSADQQPPGEAKPTSEPNPTTSADPALTSIEQTVETATTTTSEGQDEAVDGQQRTGVAGQPEAVPSDEAIALMLASKKNSANLDPLTGLIVCKPCNLAFQTDQECYTHKVNRIDE